MPHPIIPHGLESYVTDWKMSPGIEHSGFIFMTGFTGADEDGRLAKKPIDQIEAVFSKNRTGLDRGWVEF